jgi:hypothetical protein
MILLIRGCLLAILLPGSLSGAPLFDAHVHYSEADAVRYSPQQIIQKLKSNGIDKAVVTGIPAHHARVLYQRGPDRIIPLLGIYRTPADKSEWPSDSSLPPRIEAELKQGQWRGIGELHIFAEDRHSPVFRRVIELAGQYRLPLLLHADPAVIDTLYDIAPKQTVIWAHAGTFPYPDLLADYLQRYPSLFIDLSVRDDRIAPNGELQDAWYELFVRFPGRFMVGVDTYSTSRWQNYDQLAKSIRTWLKQLPEGIARQLAYTNAERLFHEPGDD